MELKKARLRAGMERSTLAAELGVTTTAVGNWERGERKPRPRFMAKIAELLGTTVDDLFFEEDEK